MRSHSTALLLGLLMATSVRAQTAPTEKGMPLPKQAPPVVGTAKLVSSESERAGVWNVELAVPVASWEVTGEVIAKREWPQLKATVQLKRNKLMLGGPSQLAESRFLNVKGEEIEEGLLKKLLANETPVLVSLTGSVPEPYYLQLVKPDALIVVLGPRDGYPTGSYFPAAGRADAKPEKELLKPPSQVSKSQRELPKPPASLPKPPGTSPKLPTPPKP